MNGWVIYGWCMLVASVAFAVWALWRTRDEW